MEHEQKIAKCVVMVMARCLAMKAVKAQLRRRGLRPQSFEQRDLVTLAYAYRDEHPELIVQAEEMIATTPRLRKIAEQEERGRARRAKMTSDAQSTRP
jgi:hypothetical protein